MFLYYGGKKRLARLYDPPAYPMIVEPFAGGAAYSVRHLAVVERVLLYEKDPRVAALWRRLLSLEPEEVLALRSPRAGERTDDFLHMTVAASNAIASTTWMRATEQMEARFAPMRRTIAAALRAGAAGKVEVVEGDYRDTPDVEATWFVDPPYEARGAVGAQRGRGQGYARGCRSTDLDYAELAEWCRRRRGQVIVCEQEGASWLPFRPLRKDGAVRRSVRRGAVGTEVVWTSAGAPEWLVPGGGRQGALPI